MTPSETAQAFFQMIEPPIQGRYQERSADLGFYYQALRELYKHKPTFEEYAALFEAFHIPAEVAQHVLDLAQNNLKDQKTTEEIRDFYPSAVRVAMDQIESERMEQEVYPR